MPMQLYRKSGALNSKISPTQHHQKILALLQIVSGPTEVAVIYFKGHQKGDTVIIKGNNLVDTITEKSCLTIRLNIG